MNTKNNAQSMMEYILVIGLVSVTVLGMSTYGRRGIQVAIKLAADQIGRQEDYAQRITSVLKVSETVGPSATAAVDKSSQDSLQIRDVSQGKVRERTGGFQEGTTSQSTYEGVLQDKIIE